MGKVKNRTKPKRSITNNTSGHLVEKRHIDFTRYQCWAYSVSQKKFTNALATEKEAAENFFFLLNELFANIQMDYQEIFAHQHPHCHQLSGAQREMAVDIVNELQHVLLGEDVNI